MKLTKQLETEVRQAYEAFWESLLNVKMKRFNSFLDENFRQIGTTETEVFFSKKEAAKFLKATEEQVVGNIELRNRNIKIEPLDKFILIIDQSDAYVKIDNEWAFYARTRSTSLLQKKEDGWKFIQQHISFPDNRTQEGETIGLEKIAKENLELRDAIKRRTVELEQKNRELEIEAALERVRASAMSMHNTDGLYDTAEILYKELFKLGIESSSSGFGLVDEKLKMISFYGINPVDGKIFRYASKVPLTETKVMQSVWSAWKNQETSLVIELNKKETVEHETYVVKCALAYFKEYSIEAPFTIEEWLANSPKEVRLHFFNFRQGCLYTIRDKRLTDVQQEMMVRFTKVFQLTYTRFLDLQTAEEQANEAKIELALERVRARAMAMQNSDELAELVSTLFKELTQLDFVLTSCIIWINNPELSTNTLWVTSSEMDKPARPIFITPFYHSFFKSIIHAWKAKDPKWIYTMRGEEKNSFEKAFFNDVPNLPHALKTALTVPVEAVFSASFNHFGALEVLGTAPLSDEKFNILHRFGKVFDSSYTRFNDLEKAEAQAREAQIELGLERVRARAMAMQRSDELAELVDTVFKELTKLHIVPDRCIITIIDENSKSASYWMANPEIDKTPAAYHVQLDEIPYFIATFNAWKERKAKWVYDLKGDEKSSTVGYIFSKTELRFLPEEAKKGMKQTDRIFLSSSFSNFGSVQADSIEPLSEENLDILYRFGKVFDMTYTRFNDLQKAEAQAREAQIEAALERVRSRTMAMHKSEELIEVIKEVFEQVQKLDFKIDTASFSLNYKLTPFNIWMAAPNQPYPTQIDVPKADISIMNCISEAIANKQDFYSHSFSFEEKNQWIHHILNTTIVKDATEDRKKLLLGAPGIAISVAMLKHIALIIANYSVIPYTAEENEVINRFAQVFEQSYTRFLDLQKAEAQAREAQIELALERVRARTMAMQQSEELTDAAFLLSNQVRELGVVHLMGTSFRLWDEDRKAVTAWTATEGVMLEPFKIPATEDPVMINIFEAVQKGEMLYVEEMGGEALEKHHQYMLSLPFVKEAFAKVATAGFPIPVFQIFHAAYFSNGYILFVTHEPCPEAHDVFKRFAKVFEQTYTRFLDLQKAEAQAREAKIEAALEKVRSRTMGMQHSNELQDTALLLLQQILALGVPQFGCGFNIWDDDRKAFTAWMGGGLGENTLVPPFKVSSSEDVFLLIHEAAERGESLFVREQAGEELETHYRYMNSMPLWKEIMEGVTLPTFQVIHCAFFPQGFLMFITYEPCPEMWDIFKRFAKVFEQTYTRFLDLQKAEAQTREAQIEAALERTRTHSMLMQHSNELDITSRVFHEQLLLLGIESEFSYVWLPDVEKEKHLFWSTWTKNENDSTVLESKSVIYDLDRTEPYTAECFIAWDSREPVHVYPVAPAEVKQYFDTWSGIFSDAEKMKPEFFRNGLYYVESFMKYGCFGIIMHRLPAEDEKKILLRFTIEFERTYTRFLDLQKAEAQAREAQIEAALERVRSRTMGMGKTDELTEIIGTIFTELSRLDVALLRCVIEIWNSESYDQRWWMANTEDVKRPVSFYIKYIDLPPNKAFLNAWKEKLPKWVYLMKGDIKREWDQRMLSETELSLLPESVKTGMRNPAPTYCNTAFNNYGCLTFVSTEALPDDQFDILIRFAKVFDQTYTRFNDLQKAEAQAREAKIEAALERVRARSMGMHKSDEINEVITLVFEQLRGLDIFMHGAMIYLFEGPDDDFNLWLQDSVYSFAEKLQFTFLDNPFFTSLINARNSKQPIITDLLNKEKKDEFFEFSLEHSDLKNISEDRKSFVLAKPGYARSIAVSKHMALAMDNFDAIEYTDEENNILLRFSKVFEQTYTRFLDLQKAEAQARESQIQLALERLRARTMAMHKSYELAEAASVMFEQLSQLGVSLWICGFNICKEDSEIVEGWVSPPDGKTMDPMYLPYNIDQFSISAYETWKNHGETYTDVVEGIELQKSHEELMRHPLMEKARTYLVEKGIAMPTWVQRFAVPYKFGYLNIVTTKLFEEADILKRFAKVFEQTYTRFLDLQKAEAQAREAQIEAALEKVRGRSMGMQKSEELKEVIQVVFEQFVQLNINIEHTGFVMDYKARDDYAMWTASKLETPSQVTIPYFDSVYYNSFNEAKEKGMDFFATRLTFEEKNRFYQDLFKYIPGLPEEAKEYIFSRPGLAVSTVLLENVGLHIENFSGIPYTDEENNTLMRFGKVFQQTYTRFLDLQKAEAQAREAQIEAALEKVRSRSMAMHKSDELEEVIMVVSEQLKQLQFRFHNVSFVIISKQLGANFWLASPGQPHPFLINVPYLDNPMLTRPLQALNSGADFNTDIITPEENHQFNQHILEYSVLKNLTEENKNYLLEKKSLARSQVLMKHIILTVGNYAGVPYTGEQNAILKRFGNVFEQAYTRFLDLQKAEAQAREAKIEAALERVRSRTMGMQKSEELKEVIQVVFEQFVHLNINVEHTGFVMDYKARDDYDIWVADPLGVPSQVTIPYFDSVYYNRFNEAKKNGEDFFATNLSFEEKNTFYEKLFKYVPGLPEEAKKFYFSCPGLAASTVLLENVCLYIENFSGISYSDEENATLMRFGKVFQQTYTRFLDLQKAEAQAREAQIEAALERVRSRTMAMQKSEDMAKTASEMFKQILTLGMHPWACGFNVFDKDEKAVTQYMSVADGGISPPFRTPLTEDPFFISIYEARQQKEELLVMESSGESLAETYRYMFGLPGSKEIFGDLENSGFEMPRFQITHCAYFSQGYLVFITYEQVPEAHDIFKRFAKVFEQTYTRFLDLQKAEAQAREARIEAALERVRSRTMAMQHSNELGDAALLLFQQIQALGAKLFGCGFNIWDDNRKAATAWMAGEDRIQPPFKTDSTEDVFLRIHEAAQRGESLYVDEMDGEVCKTHYRYMLSIPDFKNIFEHFKFTIPSFQIIHCAFFSQGYLMFITYEPVPEAHDIFKRFAKVFEQTYTRFLDLQKAEAQAREAIKQASVDRVRAEIASMRTTGDLERIQPLIWNELKTLGIPFIRCGVFIMDEEKQEVQTMLSTPEGKAIATLHVPFEFNLSIITNGVDHWRKKKMYKEHWDAAAFTKAWIKLSSLREISMDSPQAEHPPENLYLHLLPFLQGMLYAGNETPLNEDELNLVQNLADAFSTAYARYDDFNKLELAKEQIEKTLVDLKQTQAQLVQSEKMASLGELTAGIAHEIQNPLNFVNNFSEVNSELIDELKNELKEGNSEEVIAIANDIKANEEKINHHGKRADAIVKGMLQHSRSSTGQKEPTDINALADEYLRLSYHGLRAKDKTFNATMQTDFDENIGKINIIPQDIGRVFMNLFTNAFYSVTEKKKSPHPLKGGIEYEPVVTVTTKRLGSPSGDGGKVEIRVVDNGNGIPQKALDKIFQPFFTTKPTGQGTGLGLSLAYDIIKAHGGGIKVYTKEDEGAEFIIELPIK